MTHVRQAAARIGRKPVGVLYMGSIADYRHVLRTLQRGTVDPSLRTGPFVVKGEAGEVLFESPTWPESIVLDSVTDACRLIDAQILLESPPKLGKDNLPVNSERYWSVLKDRCEKLIRGFRDIDFHVLYLCLEDDRTIGEGDEAERKVGPALPMRALPDTIAAAVNVVGVMTRRIRQGRGDGEARSEAEIDHVVRTVGPQWFLLKPYRPLADVEAPDFTSWVERVRGAIDGTMPEPKPATTKTTAESETTKPEKRERAQRPRTFRDRARKPDSDAILNTNDTSPE
jgi:hypothetical protein